MRSMPVAPGMLRTCLLAFLPLDASGRTSARSARIRLDAVRPQDIGTRFGIVAASAAYAVRTSVAAAGMISAATRAVWRC
jgi:hypothetical protein